MLNGTIDIVDRQDQIDWLHARHFSPGASEESSLETESLAAPDTQELERALTYIPSDDYGTWITVGMALKAAGCECELWDKWSSKSNKYDATEIEKKWKGFRRRGLGIGTVFFLAQECGYESKTVWKEKRPLMRELPPSTAFPVDALGPVLGGMAKKMSAVIKAPMAICAQSVLAAAALAVQGHVNVEIDGRVSPTCEFFLTIAESGERKSAADNQALGAFKEFEADLRRKFKIQQQDYDNALAVYNFERDRIIRNRVEDATAKQAALNALGPAPQAPLDSIIIVDEPTYEGLIKQLATGQPSMGVFSDEGGRFIGGHAMNAENALKTAAGLSNLWDGKDVTRSRSGDGTSVLPGRRVSMHLMVQPSVAAQFLSNELLINQGLLSRILPTCPESTAGSRTYAPVNLSLSRETDKYLSAMRKLLWKELPTVDGSNNELQPRKIGLNAEAKIVWTNFYQTVEVNLGPGNRFESIRGFANKAAEHAYRLAAILADFDDPDCSEIDAKHMSAGIELAKHYLEEVLRLFHAGMINPDLALAQKTLDWLHNQQAEMISLVDIYQNGPTAIREAGVARHIMRILVEHGWARAVEGMVEIGGVRRSEVFQIRHDEQ